MKLRKLRQRFVKANPFFATRYLFTIRLPYEKLGLDRSDYFTHKDMAEFLGMEVGDRFSSYCFYDDKVDPLGNKRHVSLRFDDSTYYDFMKEDPKYTSTNPDDKFYHFQNDRVYSLGGAVGYVNPKWDYETEDEPYWLHEDDKELSSYRWDLRNKDAEDWLELLVKFANYKDLTWAFYGDPEHEQGSLMDDLSNLTQYTKTIYLDVKDDHVEVIYSCYRDKENIDEFTRDIKKLIKKHKIKL